MCFLSILSDRGGLVNASRAKRVAKTHDPLALVANTYASSSSSRSPPAYYVTHPPLEIDYDDDYQGEAICDDQEDSLTTAMMLLACHPMSVDKKAKTSVCLRRKSCKVTCRAMTVHVYA
ncbi:hypothetical protein Tco_1022804 [Tanacetum coccineum]